MTNVLLHTLSNTTKHCSYIATDLSNDMMLVAKDTINSINSNSNTMNNVDTDSNTDIGIGIEEEMNKNMENIDIYFRNH